MKYDFEITNDLITKIYDTERQIRIIGEDGAEKVIRVNQAMVDQQTGREVTLNDLSQGRYDIAVTIGPSYTTQRMEAAEAMMQLANDPSPLGMVAKYGFIKSLDMPGLEDVRKAARRIVVQAGLLEPEEGEEAPQQQQPSPDQIAQAQKAEADAQKSQAQSVSYMASAQKDAAQADSIRLENLSKEQEMQLQELFRTFLTTQIGMQGAQMGPFSFQ